MSAIEFPDIERSACAILDRANIAHPVLGRWVKRIANDPDYAESLDAFATTYSAEDRAAVENAGYVMADLATAVTERRAIADTVDTGDLSRRFWQRSDAAHLFLASGVVQFRRAGRPVGDQRHNIQGFGGPVIAITTSLAASIAEHVARIHSAYCAEMEDK